MSEIKKEIAINWDWVKSEIARTEHTGPFGRLSQNNTIREESDWSLEKARLSAKPVVLYIEKKVAGFKKDSIEIEGRVSLWGKRLSEYLDGAQKLCIFLVTVGAGIEDAATELMHNGEQLKGYLLDRAGSFAVESLAEAFEEKTRNGYAKDNMSVSARFSPGYCDWPIEEQFKLASILDFSKAGVSLNKNCMMVPKKSISAMFGIGPKGTFSQKRSSCSLCSKKDCGYRRAF